MEKEKTYGTGVYITEEEYIGYNRKVKEVPSRANFLARELGEKYGLKRDPEAFRIIADGEIAFI